MTDDLFDLAAHGFKRDAEALELRPVGVEPPGERVLVHAAVALDVAPDPQVAAMLQADTVHLLFVARMLPHKGHGHLIRALHAWIQRYEEPVRLHFVGGHDSRLASYDRALHLLAARLGVSARVEFVGSVTPEQLEAYYRGATVLAVASEHEGFCLPILEAMRRNLPVVAVARTAIPETAAAAALLLRDFDPQDMAAAFRKAALVPEERQRLIEAGQARAGQDFDPESHSAAFWDLIRPLLV